jgi:uncharacterized membrane protein YhhN
MASVGATTILLVASAGISATLHLISEYRGVKWLVYVAKPLTTLLLIAAAASAPSADRSYQFRILIGLLCSLAGDIFLMLPRNYFMPGLVSFLGAHIAYISAFSHDNRFASRPLFLLPYAVAAAVVLWLLWPGLGKLRIPVLIYVAVLIAMAWQATTRAAIEQSVPAYGAAVGAALFIVSDASLALNRFRNPFRAAQAVVMSTYVVAQVLIALSVCGKAG